MTDDRRPTEIITSTAVVEGPKLTPELIEEATAFMEPTAPTELPKTTEQHTKDLAVWLKERGVALDVAAMGRVSGALCPIEDFRSTTHAFIPILVEAK